MFEMWIGLDVEGDAAYAAINRVFAIDFPDAAARDRFFADPAYRRAKDAHFTRALRHVAILAELQRS